MSAQNNRAQTEFTIPAMINKIAKKMRAVPVIVSPFTFLTEVVLELE
jgi:hypothetical protein